MEKCKFRNKLRPLGLLFAYQSVSVASGASAVPTVYGLLKLADYQTKISILEMSELLILGSSIVNLPLIYLAISQNKPGDVFPTILDRPDTCILVSFLGYSSISSAFIMLVGLNLLDIYVKNGKELWFCMSVGYFINYSCLYLAAYNIRKYCCGRGADPMESTLSVQNSLPADMFDQMYEDSFNTSKIGKKITELNLREIMNDNKDIPDEYIDKIIYELMTDPVRVANGNVYDRTSISAWFAQARLNWQRRQVLDDTIPLQINDPLWGQVLSNHTLTAAVDVENDILSFLETYRTKLKDQEKPKQVSIELLSYQEHCAKSTTGDYRVHTTNTQTRAEIDFNMV